MIPFLDQCSAKYYEGNPIISDAQFDRLAEFYKYDKVGHTSVEAKTAKHYKQMFSLQKFYEDENKENPLKDYTDISYSPKLDGAAISLLYHKGVLVQALTRGDGIDGQLITDKMYTGKVVPLSIRTNEEYLQVTGEVVAPKAVDNARNYAAGALNLKDLEEFKTRAIVFIAYDCFPYATDTYDKDMVVLSKLGFRTVKENDLIEVYPTDGIVYRLNKHDEALIRGYTTKYPRFAYARKERQDCVETTIIGVEWNVGRTGRVTPVALLEPTMVDGKMVTRATLNNPGFIEALHICIGDKVAIRLAGMIIPEVVYKIDA